MVKCTVCLAPVPPLFYSLPNNLSAVASMRPTEALALVKFWRISPIIFILHKRSSEPLRKDFVANIYQLKNIYIYNQNFRRINTDNTGGGGMPPNAPSNSRLPQLAVWSGYGTDSLH